MNYVTTAFHRQKNYVIGHPIGFAILAAICSFFLVYSYTNGFLLPALGYLLAVWLGVLVTDVVVAAKPLHAPVFITRQSPKKELLVISLCILLGLLFLCIRFFSDWEHMPGFQKLAAMTLIVFTFPIALAIIFLFVFKYKFKELGVNFNYWYLPLLLHVIFGSITLLVAPEKSHWQAAFEEYGVVEFLFTGLITAALSEEFTRMLIQTRIAAISGNKFMGIFIAAVIWSAMHLPVTYRDNREDFTVFMALAGVVSLVPLGIFWGYLTQRTQSLLPAVLMHGFNLWGLQNF